MRADAAARRGVAHHYIVESRLGDEREAAEQRVRARIVEVHAAHQHCPVAFFRGERRERTVLGVPFRAAAFHDPGFDIIAARKSEQLALVHHAGELRQCVAHMKRTLLPVAAQEFPRRQAAEQTKVHRKIIGSGAARSFSRCRGCIPKNFLE